MITNQNQPERVPSLPSRMRHAALPLLAPVAFGVLTACGGRDKDFDQQLRADLMAAAQAPANRQMYVGPAELGYPQGYAPYPGQYQTPYGYQQAAYPQAAYPAQQPQTRVVYLPAPQTSAPRRSSGGSTGEGTAGSGSGAGTGAGAQAGRRQTEKGAIYGAAAGAAIGVISSRDKGKGAAVGALGGALLGGMIGHQVQRP